MNRDSTAQQRPTLYGSVVRIMKSGNRLAR
jgi:hypothetical protein